MKRFALSIVLLAASSVAGYGQQWEFGGAGGAGFLSSVPVGGGPGSATAGFQTGFSVGAFAGQNLYPHITGELRYAYLQSNLQLTSGGTTASFSGVAHVIHYDLLLHTNRRHSALQFFAAVGGGMKIFRGTGTEAAYQPLSQFGYFTKTQTLKPMASVGGGVSFALSRSVTLRTEFRDYITAFPTQIITPAPGTKYSSILHDFVPMVSISYTYGGSERE